MAQDNLQNPMQAAFKAYNIIESVLKQAHRDKSPLTMPEIAKHKDVMAAGITYDKARSVVETLVKNGLLVSVGERRERRFEWEDLDKTYTIPKNTLAALNKRPSSTTDVMANNVVTHEVKPKVAKELELVVAGVTIVIGKNPATGRPRIIIEG